MKSSESKLILRVWICFLVHFILLSPSISWPQTGKESSAEGTVSRGSELIESVSAAIRTEQEQSNQLSAQLQELRLVEKAVQAEMKAYRIQNSAYGNLLLLPSTERQDLEAALVENRQAINAISERVEEWTKRLKTVRSLLSKSAEQIELSELQQAEIQSGQWSATEKDTLDRELKKLKKVLSEKRTVLKELETRLTEGLVQVTAVGDAARQIASELEEKIQSRQTQALFERRILPLKAFTGSALTEELEKLVDGAMRLADVRFWIREGFRMKDSGAMPLLTLGVLALFVGLMVRRFVRFCHRHEQQTDLAQFRWRRICLSLIRHSAYYLGIAAVLFGYDLIQFPHFQLPALRLIVSLILTWTFTIWLLDFIRIRSADKEADVWRAEINILRSAIHFFRVGAIFYLLILWAESSDRLMPSVFRFGLEIGLVLWTHRFWKTFRNTLRTQKEMSAYPSPIQSAVMGTSYAIALLGLVIEFAGYPVLAEYWYASWAKSIAVIFWIVLTFHVIREWQRHHRKTVRSVTADVSMSAGHPLTLMFIQVAWLFWLLFLVDGLVLAWSTNWEMFKAAYSFMNRPWAIGKINLSNAGLIYAVIILFFTHSFSRLIRYIMVEKVFPNSDMEAGLQVSIVSIVVYVMWALGILLALGVLGVDTTSLAVIFGALSIGIGFGLQNIFNNFISGIILLFERPIQVGDAIEIGGIWGEVRKINVRATVVQTFDNASLIIPNSEFISSQVTNWSFKDKRMRRRVNVGVAYGSDIELVRETLLQIAHSNPQVLKYPHPDVLFLDHGDSALIFSLRYWTHIDNFFSTSTDIRFALDKRFRELGIEIAFPQRDIHIRSVVTDAGSEVAQKGGLQKP